MKSKTNIYKRSVTACVMVFLFMTAIVTNAAAGRGEDRRSGFSHIPRGSQQFIHGKVHYVYHQGRFYRPSNHGYEFARPPGGIIVNLLPAAALIMVVAGITYYAYDNIYYRKVPTGYQVVEVPPVTETRVIPPPTVISPAPGTQLMVTVDMLNVRTGPGLENPIKFQVYYGNMVTAKGTAPGWIYIQMPNGGDGWVMNEYVAIPATSPKG